MDLRMKIKKIYTALGKFRELTMGEANNILLLSSPNTHVIIIYWIKDLVINIC